MILTTAILIASLVFLFVSARWVSKAQEQRLELPHFTSQHLMINLVEGGVQVKARKVKTFSKTEFSTGQSETITPAGATVNFTSEGITKPHWISFHTVTRTKTEKWDSTPNRVEGYAIESNGFSTISARLVKGADGGSFDHQLPTGKVVVTFKKFVETAGDLSHYHITLGAAEAKALLKWMLRHPEHFEEYLTGWTGDTLEKLISAHRWPKRFDRWVFGRKEHPRQYLAPVESRMSVTG